MENIWYLALNDDYVGPLTVEEVRAKLSSGEISITHHVWRQGQEHWTRICDTAEFRASLPKAPVAVPPIPAPDAEELRNWFLFYNKTQYGPLSHDEVSKLIEVGQIHRKVHAWTEGMGEWKRLEAIEEFAEALKIDGTLELGIPKPPKFPHRPGAAPAPASAQKPGGLVPMEHRTAERRLLRAKLILSDDRTVNVASSHDISMGGMQVEAEEIPGAVGARIKLNVTPAADPTGRALPPFVAKGVIVRIREDRRGFSFKFDELSESAKRAIQRFVS